MLLSGAAASSPWVDIDKLHIGAYVSRRKFGRASKVRDSSRVLGREICPEEDDFRYGDTCHVHDMRLKIDHSTSIMSCLVNALVIML